MCDQCPAEFKTEGRFHLHKKLHDQNKLFSCKTCGFVASSKEALNSHRLSHRKTARVQCEYCGETKRVNNMQRHLLMHRGEKPYSCTQCDAAFRTPFDLRDHVKRRHSEVKPFSCEICEKGFICSDNLKHHLLVHSGQKPFKCPMCPSGFSRKDYLTKHIRTHTGEKPYKCSECEEAFAYPNTLKLHKKQFHSVSVVSNSAVEMETQKEDASPKSADHKEVVFNPSRLDQHRKLFPTANNDTDLENHKEQCQTADYSSDLGNPRKQFNTSDNITDEVRIQSKNADPVGNNHCQFVLGSEGQGYPGIIPAGILVPSFPTPGSETHSV